MESTTDRQKAGWILAVTLLGWIFWLLPPAEDGLPNEPDPSTSNWVIWLTVNVIALAAFHFYWGREAREAKWVDRELAKREHISNRRTRINQLNRKYDV